MLKPYEYRTFNVLKVVQISSDHIDDDVLERLSGNESFIDNDEQLDEKIYPVRLLYEIIIDLEDDTNESTKNKIVDMYEGIKEYNYFMVTNI
jgi:hypothetical protein